MEIGETNKEDGHWDTGKKKIPFSEMEPDYLQNVYTRCLKKVLYFHNRAGVFDELAEQIDEEAQKRGISLKEPDTYFHKGRAKAKRCLKEKKRADEITNSNSTVQS